MTGFNYEKDADGIVTITMDMDGPVNSMSDAFLPLLSETADKLEAEEGLTGVVLTSAKKTFFCRWRSQHALPSDRRLGRRVFPWR